MANENRLVNGEAIARKLKNAYCAECNVVRKVQCSACWVEDVLELLEGDTVDAVEVVHGRWEDVALRYTQVKEKCSICGGVVYAHDFNYCPNCGAKMDGDGNVADE